MEKDKKAFSKYMKDFLRAGRKIYSIFLREVKYVDFAYWFERTYSSHAVTS